MYCDKPSVNILSALLREHNIHDIVVCPGSRNAVLIHNFNEMSLEGDVKLYPVTDERCAAFTACGLYYAKRRPVAVCVTSGSALLNTLPAVAEAYYQHIPLLVISADRPAEAIGQLDGQTLPQVGALQPYTKTFVLDENNERWCMRVCNEALLALNRDGGTPVHINVPLSRPLFSFNTACLPKVRKIEEYVAQPAEQALPEAVISRIQNARLPILVIGQLLPLDTNDRNSIDLHYALENIIENDFILVMTEQLSNCGRPTISTYEYTEQIKSFHPDLVVHIGGNFVHKRLLTTLRELDCPVIRIEERHDDFPDTFFHLDTIVRCPLAVAMMQLSTSLKPKPNVESLTEYFKETSWNKLMSTTNMMEEKIKNETHIDMAGGMYLVAHKIFYDKTDIPLFNHPIIHLGNSTSVRLASYDYYEFDFTQYIYCNRGVNGIEGSLSTAAGHALGTDEQVYVILGDLSFFYDSNALWNNNLQGNLNVIVLNNSGGGIFQTIDGLDESPALEEYVSAHHNASAKGIAESYGAEYIAASNYDELNSALDIMINQKRNRPIIIEVLLKE